MPSVNPARVAADLDASLIVGVATGVAPERSFCFFNEVHELVLPMIACYFAFGHETPEQRQILAHAEAVGRRGGGTPRRWDAGPARLA